MLEIISALLAVGLIAAIISILAHFDGQMKPEWRYSINLNTFVALLSTIARALILVTVAEILGQAKWLWFSQQQARPVSHLEQFDMASRGWIGSFKLLTVVPKDVLALGCCLVVIFSLAIGPFSQQAIKSTACPQYSKQAQASTPIAHHMGFPKGDKRPYRTGPGTNTIPSDMKGAMANGLVNLMGNNSAISAFCPTGNCTFPVDDDGITYSSIGLCSTCIDTTSFVTSPGPDLLFTQGYGLHPEANITVFPNRTLPNGMSIYLGVETPLLNISTEEPTTGINWAAPAFTKEFNETALSAISIVTILSFTRAPCSNNSGTLFCPHNVTSLYYPVETWDYVATSCTLYPCLKNYHGSVREGVLRETVVSTLPAEYNWVEANNPFWNKGIPPDVGIELEGNFTALKNPCTIEGRGYTAETNYSGLSQAGRRFVSINVAGTNYTAPEECVYSLDRLYKNGMYWFFRDILFHKGCVSALEAWPIETQCEPAWWLSPLFNDGHATFETLSTAMDRFATIVTNRFRSTGSSNGDPLQAETAKGDVVETAVCTVFNWEWLLLPIILVAINLLLLGYMIVQSLCRRSQPIWKTSILPLLFYNIRDIRRREGEEPRLVADMDTLDKRAKHMQVKWKAGADTGFVVVGRRESGKEDEDIDLDSLLIPDE